VTTATEKVRKNDIEAAALTGIDPIPAKVSPAAYPLLRNVVMTPFLEN
jgi:hypothetical protein